MRPSLLFILLFTALFSSVVFAQLNLTVASPANNEYLTGSVAFRITNNTGEPANFSVRNVEYYFELSNGTRTLFANVTRAVVGAGVSNFTGLTTFNTTNDTTLGPFFDVLASGNFAQIVINVSHEFFSTNGTEVGVSSSLGPFYNSSTITGLTIDNAAPTFTLQFKNKAGTIVLSPFEFGFKDVVTIDCNPADATAGLANISVTIQRPDVGGLSGLSNVPLTGEKDYADTDALGKYTVSCTVYDKGSKNTTTSGFFTIISKAPEAGAYKIPGFKEPISKVLVGVGSTVNVGEITPEPLSRLMSLKAALIMNVKGEEHTMTVDQIGDDSVTLMVASEPFAVTIPVGETKNVDVTADGVDDLQVTLHMIYKKKADLTFVLLEGAAVPPATTPEPVEEQVAPQEQAPAEEQQRSPWGLLVLFVVIVLVLFLLLRFLRKKENKQPPEKIKFTPRDLGMTSRDGSSQPGVPPATVREPEQPSSTPPSDLPPAGQRRSYY